MDSVEKIEEKVFNSIYCMKSMSCSKSIAIKVTDVINNTYDMQVACLFATAPCPYWQIHEVEVLINKEE